MERVSIFPNNTVTFQSHGKVGAAFDRGADFGVRLGVQKNPLVEIAPRQNKLVVVIHKGLLGRVEILGLENPMKLLFVSHPQVFRLKHSLYYKKYLGSQSCRKIVNQ